MRGDGSLAVGCGVGVVGEELDADVVGGGVDVLLDAVGDLLGVPRATTASTRAVRRRAARTSLEFGHLSLRETRGGSPPTVDSG